MVTKGKNFSGQVTPSIIDTEYEDCNFSQPAPVLESGEYIGVRLFPGDDTPRTFTNCIMTNGEPPPGSTLTRKCVIKEFAAHVSSEYVTVDSIAIEIKAYADISYGWWVDGEYVYRPEPVEVPCEGPKG